jgi:hypothetical protein
MGGTAAEVRAARGATVESGVVRGAAEVRETSLGWNPGGTVGAVRGVTRCAKPGGTTGAG